MDRAAISPAAAPETPQAGHSTVLNSSNPEQQSGGAAITQVRVLGLDGKWGAPRLYHLSRDWTPEREELLRDLWNSKRYSASQIGRELQVTRNAVIGKARRLGLDQRTTANKGRPSPFPKIKHDRPRARAKRLAAQDPVIDPIGVLRRAQDDVPTVLPTLDGQPVRFMDLRPEHCRWVIGEVSKMLFCGQPNNGCSPYCEQHARRAYTPGRR